MFEPRNDPKVRNAVMRFVLHLTARVEGSIDVELTETEVYELIDRVLSTKAEWEAGQTKP